MSLPVRSLLILIVLSAAMSALLAAPHYQPPALQTVEVFHSTQMLELDQVQLLPENAWDTVMADTINYGFSADTFWFRLHISQLDLNHDHWMLELKYPLLDHIELYTIDHAGQVEYFKTGNNLPFSSRPTAVPEFVFPLRNVHKLDWLYLKVQSESSVQLPISLYQESEYWQQRASDVMFDAAFYAILFSMVVYNLLIYFLSRETIHLLYSLAMSSFGLLMATMHGWTIALLWPDWPIFNDYMLILFLALTEASMAYFGMTFLRLKQLKPTFYNIFRLYSLLAILLVILSLALPYTWVIKALATLAVIMSASGLLNGILLWHTTRSREVLLFYMAFVLLVIGFMVYSLQKLGIAPVSLVTEHAIEIGSVAQVILLALSMAERHNQEKQARLAAQDVIINMQREANEALDIKVRERTKDLETANQRLQHESTTDALTQTRNRRLFDSQFSILYQKAQREQQPLGLLLIDIDHFKQFNDEHGHQLGDQVLQRVAAVLRRSVQRPMDEVYRYGGEEFAVLLPNTDYPGAYQVAESMRKSVAKEQIRTASGCLNVTVSIGCCASIPHPGNANINSGNNSLDNDKVTSFSHGQQHHYELADQALYQAKRTGRNCTREANNASVMEPSDSSQNDERRA